MRLSASTLRLTISLIRRNILKMCVLHRLMELGASTFVAHASAALSNTKKQMKLTLFWK